MTVSLPRRLRQAVVAPTVPLSAEAEDVRKAIAKHTYDTQGPIRFAALCPDGHEAVWTQQRSHELTVTAEHYSIDCPTCARRRR